MVIVTFPSSVGTSISAPSRASVNDTGTSTCTSSPRRSKIGCGCTCTGRYTSPPPAPGGRRPHVPTKELPEEIPDPAEQILEVALLHRDGKAARRLLPGAGAARAAEEGLPVDPAALVGPVHLVVAGALLRVAPGLVGL